MERIQDIIKEVREKKGREWLGLQPHTYDQLTLVSRYLCQPKLQEDPRKVEELVNLYYRAKESGFLKMEDIKRKLDQLKIVIGDPDDTVILPVLRAIEEKEKEKIVIENYPKAINDLKKELEGLLENTEGQSLPQNTQDSLTTFLHYLNHPNLLKNPKLFDDMLEKYRLAEAADFTKMQALKDILNRVEIKLGNLTDEIKKWRSPEEIKGAFELEKSIYEVAKGEVANEKIKLADVWKEIDAEKKKMSDEREAFAKEKQKLEDEILNLKHEQTNLRMEKTLIEQEKQRLEKLKADLEKKFQDLESKLKGI